MKKAALYLVLMFSAPFLLQAQYTGGDGRGDASVSLTNFALPVHGFAISVPVKYEINQNYPNPFNPVTKIEFSLPKAEYVKLVIYDILGRETAVLVNEKLSPGTYEVGWNASDYTSGVYFYKLIVTDPSAGSGLRFSETKKMVLVK